jgi:hypothetical protein
MEKSPNRKMDTIHLVRDGSFNLPFRTLECVVCGGRHDKGVKYAHPECWRLLEPKGRELIISMCASTWKSWSWKRVIHYDRIRLGENYGAKSKYIRRKDF